MLQYLILEKTDDEVIFSNFLIAYTEINSQFAVFKLLNLLWGDIKMIQKLRKVIRSVFGKDVIIRIQITYVQYN